MLGSLTGQIIARLPQKVLLEVNGVGYWVNVGGFEPPASCTLFLHHHIREQDEELYGFLDLDTFQLFERLLQVNGVGPKAALQILSLGEPARIIMAIKESDTAFLALASGIGKKAAEKIALELRSKLDDLTSFESHGHPTNQTLIDALEGLGYRRADIAQALTQLDPNLIELKEQLKAALLLLN